MQQVRQASGANQDGMELAIGYTSSKNEANYTCSRWGRQAVLTKMEWKWKYLEWNWLQDKNTSKIKKVGRPAEQSKMKQNGNIYMLHCSLGMGHQNLNHFMVGGQASGAISVGMKLEWK